ncbi:ATP-binding protein [Ruminococcaceae bacterium OttesenSCG-928-I18]|nr:ATP-binding protein [Ruminococcaceae bacterium OttesenSCG-928-I18]
MNRKELYTRAFQTVESRRQKAEVQALHRSEEIYAANPKLTELDRRKSAAGGAAALLAADGKTEESRKKLREMQEIEGEKVRFLGELGLSEESMSPRWFCGRCQDTGRVGGLACTCVEEEVKRLRRETVNESGPLKLCSFDSFELEKYPQHLDGLNVSPRELMQHHFQNAVTYANEFDASSESLYMFGDAGLGKTHLALSIASVVLDRGFDVVYVSAQNAFSRLEEERRQWGVNSAFFQTLLEADLLVLDDLGTEYLDAYTRSRLYELINTRMNRKPTIYTTNICEPDQLLQRYTEKIASRLLGDCYTMRFIGLDIRLQDPYALPG